MKFFSGYLHTYYTSAVWFITEDHGTCDIEVEQRADCGWSNDISEFACKRRGCCYDTKNTTKMRCFYKSRVNKKNHKKFYHFLCMAYFLIPPIQST